LKMCREESPKRDNEFRQVKRGGAREPGGRGILHRQPGDEAQPEPCLEEVKLSRLRKKKTENLLGRKRRKRFLPEGPPFVGGKKKATTRWIGGRLLRREINGTGGIWRDSDRGTQQQQLLGEGRSQRKRQGGHESGGGIASKGEKETSLGTAFSGGNQSPRGCISLQRRERSYLWNPRALLNGRGKGDLKIKGNRRSPGKGGGCPIARPRG